MCSFGMEGHSTTVWWMNNEEETEKTLVKTPKRVFALFCLQHVHFITSFQDCCQQNYVYVSTGEISVFISTHKFSHFESYFSDCSEAPPPFWPLGMLA